MRLGSALLVVTLAYRHIGRSLSAGQSLTLDLQARSHRGDAKSFSDEEQRRLRSKRQSYPSTLHNVEDVDYTLDIEVGSSCKGSRGPQRFRVVPDTGSSDLWVYASNCTACPGRRYDLKKSCSAHEIGKDVSFKYGDGSLASGVTLSDDVKVGGLHLRKQVLIQVDQLTLQSGLGYTDGILGLAHHPKSHGAEGQTFMSRLFEHYPHIPHMFSVQLSVPDKSKPSRIVFGDPDLESNAKEPLVFGKSYYMSVASQWLTSVYSIGFDRTGVVRRFENAEGVGAPAMVDTGTSLIVLKPELWDGLMEELQKHLRDCTISRTDGSVMMCTCPMFFESIPTLVINLIDEQETEHSLCMSPQEYVTKSVDHFTGKYTCVPSIQRGSDQQPVPLILGVAFIRSFYTSFDVGQHRIGFARSIFSPMEAGTICSVQAPSDRVTWTVALVACSAAVAFATYSCVCGDIGACCGWPSCKASEPCSCRAFEAKPGAYGVIQCLSVCSDQRYAEKQDLLDVGELPPTPMLDGPLVLSPKGSRRNQWKMEITEEGAAGNIVQKI